MIDERSPDARPSVRARLVVTSQEAAAAPCELRQGVLDAIETAARSGVRIVEHYLFMEDSAEFLMDGDPVKMAPAIEALRSVIDYSSDSSPDLGRCPAFRRTYRA